jgi:hypothetical protein
MGWAYSAQGEMRMRTKFWLESLKRRDLSEDVGVDGIIILNWILGNIVEGYELDLSDSVGTSDSLL